MAVKFKLLRFGVGFILFVPQIFAAQQILIQVHLFQGVWTEGQPTLKKIEILTTSSHPELSSLKEKAMKSEREATVAAIDALLDLYGPQTVEDLFLHEKWWDGRVLHDIQWDGKFRPEGAWARNVPVFPYDTILGQAASYGIKLSPKLNSSRQIALRAVISKTKRNPDNWADMETILDQEVVLGVGDPVIVGVPYEGRVYFMMVLATIGDPSQTKPAPEKAGKRDLVAAPKAITEVQPCYPEELRRRLIGGEVGMRLTIDEKGAVQRVDVEKPLYPYLDYSAVQAFRQWTFEPVRIEGKPVPAAFRFTYTFYPRVYPQGKPPTEPPSIGIDPSSLERLRTVLDRSGDYCQRLAGAVLNFICEETIRETHYNILNNINWMLLVVAPKAQSRETTGQVYDVFAQNDWADNQPRIVGRQQIMDPKLTIRNDFVCDYLIVRKAGAVEERRIILKENGRKNSDREKLLEEKRFSGLSSLMAPLRVLARERQQRFNFRITGDEKVHGNNAFVLEAVPKSGNEDGIWTARVWVDQESYRILRSEIEGVPIDGYEDVLDDCATLNIKPLFTMDHEYRIEKNGVLFPSHSKVHAAYPEIDSRGPVEKMAINLTYDKYKFFTVETKPEIIK